MAGLPTEVVDRAREVLDFLERAPLVVGTGDGASSDAPSMKSVPAPTSRTVQSESASELRKLIDALDLNRLTPIEALVKLNELKDITSRR